MEGWIKLHRCLCDWEHYQEPSVMMVFIDLLLHANTKDGFYRGCPVKSGESARSLRTISLSVGLAVNTVRTALDKLAKSGEIKRRKFKFGTIITVSNFKNYQGTVSTTVSTTVSMIDTPSDTAIDTSSDTKQEYKEGEEEKNKEENIPSSNEDVSVAPAPDPETDKEKVDLVGLKNFFNMTMNQAGAIIPRCKSCGGKRAGYVKARIREYGLDSVYEMITKASVSDFLNGKNNRGWKANFEWLFLPTNFPKVLEGIYDNKSIQHNNGNNQSYRKSIAEQQRERLQSECEAIVSRRLAEDNAH